MRGAQSPVLPLPERPANERRLRGVPAEGQLARKQPKAPGDQLLQVSGYDLDISLMADAAGVSLQGFPDLAEPADLMRLCLPEDLEFSELRRGGGGEASFARFTARQEDITILDTSFALEPSASQTIAESPGKGEGEPPRQGSPEWQQSPVAQPHPGLLPAEEIAPLDLSVMIDQLRTGRRLLFPTGDFERLLCDRQLKGRKRRQEASMEAESEAEKRARIHHPPTVSSPPPPSSDVPPPPEAFAEEVQPPPPGVTDFESTNELGGGGGGSGGGLLLLPHDIEVPREHELNLETPLIAQQSQQQLGATGISILSAIERLSPIAEPPLLAQQQPPLSPIMPPPRPLSTPPLMPPLSAPPPPRRRASAVVQFELQPLQPRSSASGRQTPSRAAAPAVARPRLLIVDGITEFRTERLRWNLEHGGELLKPLELPRPASALTVIDAAALLLGPGHRPISDRLKRVWERQREESAHYVLEEVPDFERPRFSTGRPSRLSGLSLSTMSFHSGQNLPRISEEAVTQHQLPTVIASEVAPPESRTPPPPPPHSPPPPPPPRSPPPPPAFEDILMQPLPPPDEVFASSAAAETERPRLSQEQVQLMEGLRRIESQQQQQQQQQQSSSSDSEQGEDYRPFSSLCPPGVVTRKEAARAFAGLLELVKQRRIRMRQEAPYEEIFVKPLN